MLPTAAGSILLKKCESESELEHQKYEKMVLQLGCLMQTGIDGYEIYKNVGVMHAVVFAGRAQGLKVHKSLSVCKMLMGSRSEKIAIGTGKRAKRANQMLKNALIEAVWGSKKWNFQSKVHEIVLQNCAPRRGRNNNFEKM